MSAPCSALRRLLPPPLLQLALLLVLPAPFARAAPNGLTVVPGTGDRQTDATTVQYNFGTRRLSDESPLEHTFTVRNGGAVPVTLDRLQSSCGCTSAVVGGDRSLPLTLPPGAFVPLRVTVSPHRLLPGEAHKSVWVYAHGGGDAVLLLEMVGTLQDDPVPAASAPAAPSPEAARPAAAPHGGDPAPDFTRADTAGRPFTLSAQRGRPLALFFFCGCPWCADVARAWSRDQRRAARPADAAIVYAGPASEAAAFARRNGLDPARTRLLPDPDSALTERVYRVASCPRAFALDAVGVIRYTNDHADDRPRLAPTRTIAARVAAALR